MTTIEIIQLFLGSGGLLGILFLAFRTGKIVQKIDTLEEHCNKNFLEMKMDIKDIKRSISSMEVQIGRLETRVEERTLRVVKDTYMQEPAIR